MQVYRLSDLALLKTIRLPTSDGPNEPRVLKDGRTVLVSTVACRLYHVAGLDGADPQLELVHGDEKSGCAMPVVIGDYWIQSNAATHRIYTLDVHDLSNVRVVSSVDFDERQRPHWLATDGSRIVVVNEPAPTAERRMWMLDFDRATGEDRARQRLPRRGIDATGDRVRSRKLAARRDGERGAARHGVRLVE